MINQIKDKQRHNNCFVNFVLVHVFFTKSIQLTFWQLINSTIEVGITVKSRRGLLPIFNFINNLYKL